MAASTLDLRHAMPVRNSIRSLPAIPTATKTHQPDHSRDFWIPQVTQDGQIFYANTVTGKRSRDLPTDTEDVLHGDFVGLTHSTGNFLGFVSGLPATPSSHPHTGLSGPVNTSDMSAPTPRTIPVKPLPIPLDMGTALRPRANTDLVASNRQANRVPGVLFDSLTAQWRHRSYNSFDSLPLSLQHKRSISSGQSISPPSSNTLPLGRETPRLIEPARLSDILDVEDLPRACSPQPQSRALLLAPPSSDIVSELLERARQCIHAAVLHLKQFGIPRDAEDEEIIDNLICSTIAAIRDLLYVSGPSFQHLGGKNKTDNADSDASQTPLVPAQRRAVATLSKFVLSARAVLNDGPWTANDNVSQLSSDADELERSVIEFVSIAQGVRSQGVLGPKRLHGYLAAPHAGPARAGAGAAGTWKGFGWVDLEDHEEAPRQNLTTVTFNEFIDHISRIQERLSVLTEVLRATRPAEVVTTSAQELFKELSSLLLFLGDIHIARHVDIETIDQAKLSNGAQYMRTVEKARVVVRSFEATIQAIYDDGAALLVATQLVRRVEPCESWKGRDMAYDTLETLSSSFDFNLKISRQNLEDLMRIGIEQSAILEQCNQSQFEWRMSQRSLISAILTNQALEAIYDGQGPYDITTDEPARILQSVAEDADDTPLPPSPLPPPIPTKEKPRAIPINRKPVDISWEDGELMKMARMAPSRLDKIEAFFGDDAPSHYLSTLRAEAKPWYLRPHYDNQEVLIDPDGTVRGGTIVALVERLTAHEYADTNFTRAFLMTFKSFMTLDELFNHLVDRFWIQPPLGLNSEELEDWKQNKRNIIRIRVINAMKMMIQDDDVVDKDDTAILNRMAEFASQDDVFKIAAAKQLLAAIKRARAGNIRKVTIPSSVPPPAPIVPKRIELLDIDPLEFARQLTITESQLYQKIRPSECLQRSMQSKTEYHDGVANFIRRSNRIAHWVTYEVLCRDEPRRRATVMKQFIQIADRCRVIQNFSTMMAIVTGLNSSPIHRLKRSWEQVSSKYMLQLGTCERLINSYKRYNSYRNSLANVSPPCVPFVGVFLTALTHIQDGSKDHLPGNLVNFRKRQKASEVVQDLQRWQTQLHNFHPLPSVLAFIDEALSQFGDHDASEVFWKLSLEREPREREDEKLAKWLSDSGFA